MANKNRQGKAVLKAIRAAGMSQGEFSRRLGVSPSYTSRVIAGTRRFGITHIAAVSRILSVPLETLLP